MKPLGRSFPAGIILIILCTWGSPVTRPAFCQSSPPRDLFHRQAVIIGSGLDDPYPLPDKLLIEDSEQVYFRDS